MFDKLKKKITDIETQSLAMDGCSPSFSVNDILSIIDSVGKDIDVTTTDTISRQAAIDLFPDDDLEWDTKGGYIAPHLARRMICELPSAQPEIVRCKDCKYWREHKYAKETKRYIPFCGFNAIYTKADDFCSRAERREE